MNDEAETTQQADTIPQGRRVAISGGGKPVAIIPQNMDELGRVATAIFRSGLAPYQLKTPEAVGIAIMFGAELGLPPMASTQSIAVINNRPCLWGDAVPGICYSSGQCEYIKEWSVPEDPSEAFEFDQAGNVVGPPEVAWFCQTKRRGQPDRPGTKFTLRDAIQAGLNTKRGKEGQKTPWQTATKRMGKMRARGFELRDAFPDLLRGLPLYEEAMDMPPNVAPEAERRLREGGNALAAEEVQIAEAEPARSQEAPAQEGPPQAPRPVRGRRRNAAQADPAPAPSQVVQETAPVSAQTAPVQAAQAESHMARQNGPDSSIRREIGPGRTEDEDEIAELKHRKPGPPQEPKPAEPNKLGLLLAKWQLGLSNCKTVREVTDFGTAWRDQHQKIRNGTAEEQGVAAGMLKDYEKKLGEAVAEAERQAKAKQAQEPAAELALDEPEPKEAAPKVTEWPPEVEARIVAANSSIVRSICEEIWNVGSIVEIEEKYAEIGAREEYPLLTGNERMAFYKAREASAARFIRG